MQKLLVGRQLGYSINPEGIIDQQRQIKGTFFGFLARIWQGFPHTISRYVDLLVFAKAFFPAQFGRFQAANPGLPSDLAELASVPQPVPAGPAGSLRNLKGRPLGWTCASGTLAVMAVSVLLAKNALTATAQELPELLAEPTAAGAAAAPTDSAPHSPPHVHLDAEGRWAPDPGCSWVSAEPKDLRVVCR
jgi:hypothetical protein